MKTEKHMKHTEILIATCRKHKETIFRAPEWLEKFSKTQHAMGDFRPSASQSPSLCPCNVPLLLWSAHVSAHQLRVPVLQQDAHVSANYLMQTKEVWDWVQVAGIARLECSTGDVPLRCSTNDVSHGRNKTSMIMYSAHCMRDNVQSALCLMHTKIL